jgi:ATP-dependent DNA helicase RecG
MDAHSRRQAALDAIQAVLAGARAHDVETETVDFTEEHGSVRPDGSRTRISSRSEPAARALAEEAACLAMSPGGGVLVVGVNDAAAGRDAFVGSYLDLDWLRRRIYALTQPNMALDVIEEHTETGARLYLINVPPALEEVRVGGKLRARQGTDCVEVSGDLARRFLEQRRRYDWSAEESAMRLSDARPDALRRAHERYREAHGRRAGSDLDLTRHLGINRDDEDDPTLNRAGALLLCEFEPDVERLDIRAAIADGARADAREILKAPLLVSFDSAWKLIDDAFPARGTLVGAQRRSIRALPEDALREALVNAIMHRDYRLPRAPIVALALGRPSVTLKVVSPGGFPPAVDGSRLLAARSQPTNPALADAMRTLGFAEREGSGIPTMFRALLRDGHPQPEIYAEGGDVVCRLPGGAINPDVRAFFDSIYARDPDLEYDVRVHIAIEQLLSSTPLRVEQLSASAQCSEGEAESTLKTLVDIGAVSRLLDRSRSYRLVDDARRALAGRLLYRTRSSIDDAWTAINAYLDIHESIGRSDAAELLGVTDQQASRTLSKLLKERGVLALVGKPVGRGVRYRRTDNFT